VPTSLQSVDFGGISVLCGGVKGRRNRTIEGLKIRQGKERHSTCLCE
jgi:hypothetical protein